MASLRAIIFDFDGVVADSEPIHLAVFQRVLGELGLFLSPEEYYAEYLGYDDRGCFRAFLTAHGHSPTDKTIDDLVARKAAAYLEHIKRHLVIFPGVRELVRDAAARHRLAIASGALRNEIEYILECAGIRKEFEHITSAEDVRRGKPDPEPFVHALTSLNRVPASGQGRLAPGDCLVVEDSIPGIRAAHAAGMKVLAVANTHTVQDLHEADALTHSLANVRLPELEARLWPADAARRDPR
jgi:HAD superfamily hydrolase (TIGR01509 family)